MIWTEYIAGKKPVGIVRGCVALLICLGVLLTFSPRAHGESEETLEELIGAFLDEWSLDEKEISIAYFNTVTEEEFFYNKDRMMLAASLYKIPLNMYYYEQEALGKISPDKLFAGYPLSRCRMLSLQYSENSTSLAMRFALGTYSEYKTRLDKYTGVSAQEIGGVYLAENYFSAETFMNIMKYFYENSEFFDEAIGYLKEAQPGNYFKKYISDYEIAQKYGYLDNCISTAGIIYTPMPFLLCVFTENVAHSERIIGELSMLLCEYTVSRNAPSIRDIQLLDARVKEWFYKDDEKDATEVFLQEIGNWKYVSWRRLRPGVPIMLSEKIYT